MDIRSGQPSGLEKSGDQQHAVEAAAEHLPADGLQRRHLRHHVAAQRRVAAADELEPRAASLGHGHQAASGESVELDRGRLVEAARVGQDEAGRGRTAERGLVDVLLEDGHDLDVVHRLRSGRVVVEYGQEEAVRDSGRANRLPEGIVVREGPG